MPSLDKAWKETKKFGPKVLKQTKKSVPKFSGAAKDYASKAAETTKDFATHTMHTASDYGQKAADFGHKKAERTKDAMKTSKKKPEKHMPEPKKKKSPLIGVSLTKAFLMIVGSAAAALLFAPKSGKETREDLKQRANSMKDKGMHEAQGMMDDVKETYSEVKDKRHDESPLSNQTFSTDHSEVTSPIAPSNPDAVPVQAGDPAPLTGTSESAGEPMVTDEYASDSVYDEAEPLSVPLEEGLEPSSLETEEEQPADTSNRENSIKITPEDEV